jgi:plastocyanin
MVRVSHRIGGVVLAALLAPLVACGGGGSSPTSPSSPVSGSPGPVGATITIGANGSVSPATVTISVGQSVSFVNNHNIRHDMSSDPHPTHTDCPQMNAVSVLNAGQTKSTNAFPTARTCGFHDHDNPDAAGLRGTIVIQ